MPQRGCQTARCSKAEEGEAHARIGRKRKKRKRRNSDPSGNDSLDDIPGAPDTTKEFAYACGGITGLASLVTTMLLPSK